MKLGFSILLVSSTLFFTRGISSHPFAQGHLIFTIIMVYISAFYLVKNCCIDKKTFSLSAIFLISVVHLVVQSIFMDMPINFLVECGRYSLPLLILAIFSYFFNLSSNKTLIVKSFIICGTAVFLTDMLFRLAEVGALSSRYSLKHGGFMFVDSNFSGIFVVCLYYLLTVAKFTFKSSTVIVTRLTLFAILVSTGSIAAYLMFLIVAFFRKFKFVQSYLFALIMMQVSFVAITYTIVGDYFADGSFITKVNIIGSAVLSIQDTSWTTFFWGQGLGLFTEITQQRYPSHNLFGLFVEGGIVFGITQLLVIYVIRPKSAVSAGLVFAIGVVGLFSLYPLAYISAFWCVIVLMNHYSDRMSPI